MVADVSILNSAEAEVAACDTLEAIGSTVEVSNVALSAIDLVVGVA